MYLGKDRKLNRWMGHDYSTPGWYFITICTNNLVVQFGEVKNGEMVLNVYGQIALKYLKQIPNNYQGVELDEFQIMPNHIHGMIFITDKAQNMVGAGNNDKSLPVGTEHAVGVENDEKLMTVGTEHAVGAGNNGKSLPVGTEHAVGVENDEKLMTVGTEYYSVPTRPTPTVHYGLLSKIIKSFKHMTTKEIHREFNDHNFTWQRSFHDHVIRGEEEYNAIKYYIQQNPAKWADDRNNPQIFKKCDEA